MNWHTDSTHTHYRFARCLLLFALLLLATPASAIFIPPHVTHVPPVPPKACQPSQVCQNLITDGNIGNIEWVDSARAPFQDFASGNPTGKLFLMQQNPGVLSIGIRVARGNGCSIDQCGPWYTILLLDARRADTLMNFQAATQVREDDRALVITHFSPFHHGVEQFRGDPTQNTWIQTTNQERWPVDVQVSGFGGFMEIELAINLKPNGSNQPSEVLTNGRMGLGVVHSRLDLPSFFSLNYWPGNAGIDPVLELLNAPNYFIPYTWQTIEFSRPPPTDLSLLTYNIGQLPTALFPNGGSGDIADFAAIAADPGGAEIMCFQEVWGHDDRVELAYLADLFWKVVGPAEPGREIMEAGAPSLCDGEPLSPCTPAETLLPGSGIGIPDTGLLLLSKNPVFGEDVTFYEPSMCKGADCTEAKGALWARVGTSKSKRLLGPDKDVVAYDPDEYVDVFCTHLQASCDALADATPYLNWLTGLGFVGIFNLDLHEVLSDLSDGCDENDIRKIQASQLAELRAFVDQRALPPDRPAFVMGDFNANGGDAHLGVTGSYGKALSTLGLTTLASFDAANSLYSKRYDIALGCKNTPSFAVPPVTPNQACDPLLTTEVLSFTSPPGQPKWQSLGVGTNLSDQTFCDHTQFGTVGDVNSNRYDHVFVIPPRPQDELPVFAIPNDVEPFVEVHTFPTSSTECLSDHKAVFASVSWARLEDRLTFNPNMNHDVWYVIDRVENKTGDASGGAEFFASINLKDFGVFADDKDVIYPKWSLHQPMQGVDFKTFYFRLFEEDLVDDDAYDVTKQTGAPAWSAFKHDTSVWSFYDQGQFLTGFVCLEMLHKDCFDYTIGAASVAVPNEGTYPKSERAKIIHSILTKEAP